MEQKNNKKTRYVSVEELENAYKNNNLGTLLTILSDEELNDAFTYIVCDDIVGIRINILDAIEQEKSSRIQESKKQMM